MFAVAYVSDINYNNFKYTLAV